MLSRSFRSGTARVLTRRAARSSSWSRLCRSGAAAAMSSGAAGAAAGGEAPGAVITDTPTIRKIAAEAKRVAVLGIKTEAQAGQPAYYVPQYLQGAGVDVLPVPVYYPEVTEILGQKVYRKVSDVPGPQIDIVDVFRRPQDLAAHLDDIIAARPRAVWLQSGISDAAFEAAVAAAGINVIADRCLLVEHQAAVREGRL